MTRAVFAREIRRTDFLTEKSCQQFSRRPLDENLARRLLAANQPHYAKKKRRGQEQPGSRRFRRGHRRWISWGRSDGRSAWRRYAWRQDRREADRGNTGRDWPTGKCRRSSQGVGQRVRAEAFAGHKVGKEGRNEIGCFELLRGRLGTRNGQSGDRRKAVAAANAGVVFTV